MDLSAKQRATVITGMKPGDSLTGARRPMQFPTLATVLVELDGLRTVNALNAREHHFKTAKRRREHRDRAFNALAATKTVPSLPVVVEMCRVGRKYLDSDGLAASLKSVRDGIADAYGVDDADAGECQIRWKCSQAIGAYAVRITITADGRQL